MGMLKPRQSSMQESRHQVKKKFLGKRINPYPILMMGIASLQPVNASEFDILAENEPRTTFLIDDAAVLSRTTRDEINNKLSDLETNSGFKLILVTTRKLDFNPNAFTFSDKVFGKWHKSDGGDKNGLLLLVTAGKDGAIVGGNAFLTALG